VFAFPDVCQASSEITGGPVARVDGGGGATALRPATLAGTALTNRNRVAALAHEMRNPDEFFGTDASEEFNRVPYFAAMRCHDNFGRVRDSRRQATLCPASPIPDAAEGVPSERSAVVWSGSSAGGLSHSLIH